VTEEAARRATVSVVVPVHNGMPHLPETLASVFAQTRTPDEIVVVENGSTDGTAEWLAAHAPTVVRVIIQPALVSAAENWTSSVQSATGELVKLLCADDVLEPTAIEAQSAALERHPAAVLAASQRTVVDNWGATVARNRGLGRLDGEVAGREVIRACALRGQNLLGEPCSVMFRKVASAVGRQPAVRDRPRHVRACPCRWPRSGDPREPRAVPDGHRVLVREPEPRPATPVRRLARSRGCDRAP